MLAEDRDAFFHFVQQRDPVVVTLRDAHTAVVEPVADIAADDREILCLWNRRILPSLEREWVPESRMGPYYTVDLIRMPVLEFSSSFHATWRGKPALGQGRLYGIFDADLGKPPEFQQWFETLVRWIKKNFRRNPTGLGGYLGPAAYEFFEKGGYLLPNFIPPRTKEWLDVIGKQHARPKAPAGSRHFTKARR
jgi:hypothetical protein